MASLSKYLLIMELSFDAILYSKFGNKNYGADHTKCSHRPQIPHPWSHQSRNFSAIYFWCVKMLLHVKW